MGLYAIGKNNKTAAITEILNAVNARITTLADGSKSLDVASLQTWVGQQATAILNQDVLAANRAAANDEYERQRVSTQPMAETLANRISAASWQTHPNWPTAGTISSSGSFLTAAKDAMIAADAAGARLDDHHTNPKAKITLLVSEEGNALKLLDRLPEAKTRILNTVYYIYTYVTDWDEESAPSPPSDAVEVDQDDEVAITIGPPPPGLYIKHWRVYATATGSTGTAFFFLRESPITTLAAEANPRAILGEVCPTEKWLPPNPKMRGMTAMPNGVLAGYFDNVVCFSEPYVPYAWPVEYQLTTSHPIVSLGSFGQTLVVGHYGGIDYISGADSASMSSQKDISKQAPASSRSMVSTDMGVVYASQDGVCVASNSGVQVISQKHFSREAWQALNPSTMVGTYHEGTYYFFGGFGFAYSLHLTTGKLTRLETGGGLVSAAYQDPITDGLYFCAGTQIFRLGGASTRLDGTWRSKKVILPHQQPLAWLSVESDYTAPVTVRWFGDGALRHTVTLDKWGPVRLPPGRYLEHEVEIVSKGTVSAVTLASTTQELQQA